MPKLGGGCGKDAAPTLTERAPPRRGCRGSAGKHGARDPSAIPSRARARAPRSMNPLRSRVAAAPATAARRAPDRNTGGRRYPHRRDPPGTAHALECAREATEPAPRGQDRVGLRYQHRPTQEKSNTLSKYSGKPSFKFILPRSLTGRRAGAPYSGACAAALLQHRRGVESVETDPTSALCCSAQGCSECPARLNPGVDCKVSLHVFHARVGSQKCRRCKRLPR
jgi:hypothetical protein